MRLALRVGFLFCLAAFVATARGHWTELNIGPFYVDTDGDAGAAREVLTQLEQMRWVLGGLLESKDLPSVWPIRVLLTNAAEAGACRPEFARQEANYLLICRTGAEVPLDQIAGLLLDENTPRLPADVESGLRQLFGTLKAKGSRVSWGGRPEHPDLAWARMQLFATKFEYSSSFHIFLTALKSGSTLRGAEQNAFGKDDHTLEQEAKANLAAGNWEATAVSGRPLDPKRDLGEHSLEESVAEEYLGAGKKGGETNTNLTAGKKNATAYVALAAEAPPEKAVELLRIAERLNPLWAEPVHREAELTQNAAAKEALLKRATQLDPRNTAYWIELARLQTEQGEATAAQGTWLRAENSGATETERERVHQLRIDSEQERLDAAEEARRREREAVHLSDERAQQAEADRIRAAEQQANANKDAAAGGEKAENPIPWSEVKPNAKRLSGVLVRVDCIGGDARLYVKDQSRTVRQLLLHDRAQVPALSCGEQKPVLRVGLTYTEEPDDTLQTSGTVVRLTVVR